MDLTIFRIIIGFFKKSLTWLKMVVWFKIFGFWMGLTFLRIGVFNLTLSLIFAFKISFKIRILTYLESYWHYRTTFKKKIFPTWPRSQTHHNRPNRIILSQKRNAIFHVYTTVEKVVLITECHIRNWHARIFFLFFFL